MEIQGRHKPMPASRRNLRPATAKPSADRPLPTLPAPKKGRGAVGNPTGRFEPQTREGFDDGWARPDDDLAPKLQTRLSVDRARTVITRNQSPDLGFDRSINPYRGCEHGCVYCFARPTHAFLGLSPGLDFESRIFVKPDAPALLAKELRRRAYQCRPIAMGTNTDPYQPAEKSTKVTRGILEVLRDFKHPVSIVTKSALVTRDADILADMAAQGLAKVAISVTTLDRDIARTMEPRASTPAKRLAAMRSLSEAGIPVVAMAAPVIPVLTDPELEAILEAARDAGASSARYILLRLPLEVKDLFAEWLDAHAPLKKEHVLNLVRETRDGRLNDPDFFSRQVGSGPYAELIKRRFYVVTRKLGLDRELPKLDTTRFAPPPAAGEQLMLL
jgi:DNA repair photolyase